ncbi:MAG TPA: hypothetical protein VME24_09190 [Alphaproteobacteria bacterium]|nr:hypothetical protein [Alphaproteobacteria bacterium]
MRVILFLIGATAVLTAAATALRIFFEAGERLLDAAATGSSCDEDFAAVRSRLTRTAFPFSDDSVGFVLIMANPCLASVSSQWEKYAFRVALATQKWPKAGSKLPLFVLQVKVLTIQMFY